MSTRPVLASWFDIISDILHRLADVEKVGFVIDIEHPECVCH